MVSAVSIHGYIEGFCESDKEKRSHSMAPSAPMFLSTKLQHLESPNYLLMHRNGASAHPPKPRPLIFRFEVLAWPVGSEASSLDSL